MQLETQLQPWLSSYGLLIVSVLFVAVATLEMLFPQQKLSTTTFSRWRDNFLLYLLATLVRRLMAPLVVLGISFNSGYLASSTTLPLWAALLSGLIIFDLAAYLLHRCMHHFPILWRIHAIHHAPVDVDLTTAWCFHPLDSVITLTYQLMVLWLVGLPAESLVFYQAMSGILSYGHHANFRVSERLYKLLSPIFILPADHRVHHSSDLHSGNTNFSVILSLWDHVFRTRGNIAHLKNDDFRCGIRGQWEDGHPGLLAILKAPFVSQPAPPTQPYREIDVVPAAINRTPI